MATIAGQDSNGENRTVLTDTEGKVYTIPSKSIYNNTVKFFTNIEYGADMNQNATPGGTVINVHNGLDNVYWTGTNEVSTGVNFQDPAQHYDGIYCMDFRGWSNVGDLAQFTNPFGTVDLSSYAALRLYVYVYNNWKDGDSVSVVGFDTTSGLNLGKKAFLENYIDINTLKEWQQVTIPLSDLGLVGASLDALRFQYDAREGTAVNFFLDAIKFIQVGGSIDFELQPDAGTWLYVDEINFHIASTENSTLPDSALPYLPYNKFGGLTLIGGILYQRIQSGNIMFNTTLKNVSDFMENAGTQVSGAGSDGANTWVSFRVTNFAPLILKSETNDKLVLRIQDDLSSLLKFRTSVGARILSQ